MRPYSSSTRWEAAVPAATPGRAFVPRALDSVTTAFLAQAQPAADTSWAHGYEAGHTARSFDAARDAEERLAFPWRQRQREWFRLLEQLPAAAASSPD